MTALGGLTVFDSESFLTSHLARLTQPHASEVSQRTKTQPSRSLASWRMIDSSRLQQLREQATTASDEVLALDASQWPDASHQTRLSAVLAYGQSILNSTDPDLVTGSSAVELEQALTKISNNPGEVPASAIPDGDRILDAVARLPVARGHEAEQAAKNSAATFQRSAQQRLAGLRNEIGGARSELRQIEEAIQSGKDELASTIDERRTEIATKIESLQTEFAEKLAEFGTQIETERTAFSELRTSQTQTFESSQTEHAASTKETLQEFQKRAEEMLGAAQEDVDKRVAEIQRMEAESAALVGAIGLAGTAERYGEEVDEQKRVADMWRRGTVVLALLAVVGVIVAVAEKHPVAETFAGKLALSIILGGIATYAARQSSYHRRREHHARDLQLELTAFSPFIEPLAADQQEEERVIMTRKTFGKTTAAPAPDEEPGPTPLSFALRRREKGIDED
jgi:hypothetical protein